jgi:hypothetical protein
MISGYSWYGLHRSSVYSVFSLHRISSYSGYGSHLISIYSEFMHVLMYSTCIIHVSKHLIIGEWYLWGLIIIVQAMVLVITWDSLDDVIVSGMSNVRFQIGWDKPKTTHMH